MVNVQVTAPPHAHAEPLIHGGGTPEAAWQAWQGLHAIAPVTIDELVPAAARLVIVAPHPDDEVLGSGGLLALHVARGGQALLLAVTDGEASHADQPNVDPAHLAQRRRAESADGLEKLGACAVDVRRLGLPDGGVSQQRQRLVHALREQLRSTDVLVSTWRHDGHPDHDATGTAAHAAALEVGCTHLEAPVWMWHWSAPNDTCVPWAKLRALTLPTAVHAMKQLAVAEHQTQLAPRGVGALPVLGPEILARARRFTEYFFVQA